MPYPSSTQGNAVQRAMWNGQTSEFRQQQADKAHAANQIGQLRQRGEKPTQSLLDQMNGLSRPNYGPSQTQPVQTPPNLPNPFEAGGKGKGGFSPVSVKPNNAAGYANQSMAPGMKSTNIPGSIPGARSTFANTNPFRQLV